MEQTVELDQPGKKTLKEILREGLFDIIGFDRGVLRTLVDLIRQPDNVIKAYHRSDMTYTRPVAFIILGASLFLLISNYAVDWEIVFEAFVMGISTLAGKTPNPAKLIEAHRMFDLFVDILFRKYVVVFYILTAFTRAASLVRITRDATFASMLVIMLYRNAGSLIIQGTLVLFIVFFPNIYGLVLWSAVGTIADQYLFRNYINKILGHGTKRSFQKRVILVVVGAVVVTIMTLFVLEYLGIIKE